MQPSPIQEIQNELLRAKKVKLFLKRDDLIHPSVSGNKWRKLKYNLVAAKELNHRTLLTFGGAFSNHIHAVAAAGKVFDFKTIGIIRGDRMEPLNATLQYAEDQGMQLHFVPRSAYRQKNTASFCLALEEQFGRFYNLPEGGTNTLALKGCAEIIVEIKDQLGQAPDYITTCVGTGGTIAGIIKGSASTTQTEILGVSALKGNFLKGEVEELLAAASVSVSTKWSISNDYHFGGYAKFKPSLIEFINDFKKTYQIALDPIYTGKLMYGIFDLIKKDYFKKDSTVVAIHTGGLQGISGFNQRYGNLMLY